MKTSIIDSGIVQQPQAIRGFLCLTLLLYVLLDGLAACPGLADAPPHAQTTGNAAPIPSVAAPPTDRVTLAYGATPNGQLIIWVWLNGNIPARFALDTGSNVCAITGTLAGKLGLTPQPGENGAGKPVTLDGKRAPMVKAPMLQVGTIRYPNFPMVVLNAAVLSDLSGMPIDGLVGVTALTTDPVFIDFQQHQATLFYDAPVTTTQLRSLGMEGAFLVPLTDYDGNLKFQGLVQFASGSKKASASLTIDTGSTHTNIPEATARSLGLNLKGPTYSYSGVVSDTVASDVPVPSVSFGSSSTEIGGLKAICVRGDVPNGFPLSVGLDVLSHFQVLIDFGAKKMYLKPVSASGMPVSVPRITTGGK